MKGGPAILISALLGFLATVFVFLYLNNKEEELLQLSDMKPAVVAAQDLLPGMAIEESMVAETQVPRKFLQPGALTSIKDVVGQIPAVPIPQGAQITGTSMTGVGRGLATKIPRGTRAISLAVNEVSGVAGLIRPNNYVDVLAVITTGSGLGAPDQRAAVATVLQNVLVLAVGRNTGELSARKPAQDGAEETPPEIAVVEAIEGISSVTLAVTPEDAQNLALAQQIGDVSFTLRSYLERDTQLELGRATVNSLLGFDEKVVPRRIPSWREFRGAEP